MNKFQIIQQNRIQITGTQKTQSVEIDKNVIDNGFLKNFPDSSLSIFLYLSTHFDQNNNIILEPSVLTKFLPYDLKTIVQGLNYLEENNIIEINHNQEKPVLEITINFDNILKLQDNPNSRENNSENTNKARLPSSDIIEKDSVSIKDLTEALISFIPLDKKQEEIKENINQWIVDFDPKVLQELIRRVVKWQKNTDHTRDKAFYYMKAIIEDWYNKEIFTYDRLQYFDKLYRETKELARVYGINWNNLNSVQMQTFKSWLTDDFALSLEVTKFAIKQAIKRKKDGQPSIQYIEDNYIKPWKKQKIRTITDAKKFMSSQKFNNNSKSSTSNTKSKKENSSLKSDWDKFSWDLEEMIKGGQ